MQAGSTASACCSRSRARAKTRAELETVASVAFAHKLPARAALALLEHPVPDAPGVDQFCSNPGRLGKSVPGKSPDGTSDVTKPAAIRRPK
jgi:hypothetical protein